jgi:predicted nucleotidyltransferase
MQDHTLLDVIEKIAPGLKENHHIHAMWLEGSYATGEFNEHSDIDVWLDVDDGMFDQCIETFRKQLERIGEIDREEGRGIYSTDPKLAKHVFHLKGFPEEQAIELDLQEHSRMFEFSKTQDTIKVLFDKDRTIKWKDA